MKNFKRFLCALSAAVLVGLSAPAAAARQKPLPPGLSQRSTLREILDYLDRNFFPHARVGMKSKGPETYTSYDDPDRSMKLSHERLSEEVVLSQGFRLDSLDGCELTLKNDHVEIADFWTKSYDRELMSLSKFTTGWGKDRPPLKPRTAFVSIALDQMSHRKGEGPYRHTRDAEVLRRVGTWRTKYESRGFWRSRSFVGMEVYAAPPADEADRARADTLTFTFDDREMSERFDAAFRRAIKLCSGRR